MRGVKGREGKGEGKRRKGRQNGGSKVSLLSSQNVSARGFPLTSSIHSCRRASSGVIRSLGSHSRQRSRKSRKRVSLVLTATARSRVPGRCFRPLELVIQRGLPLESIVCVCRGEGEGRGGGGGEGGRKEKRKGVRRNGMRGSGVQELLQTTKGKY